MQAATASDARTIIREATVTLDPPTCAGVIVGDARHAITAAHCAGDAGEPIDISLFDNTRMHGTFELVDRARDIALIRLDRLSPVHPLQLSPNLPEAGARILFTSRMDHPGEPQWAEIESLAPCPSLPFVPAALHTSLRGRPGDSGGPVVDLEMHVIGLVHGGARCSIAAPTAGFAPVLSRALEQDRRIAPLG